MNDDERRALQCDLLVFVATQTEEEQLLAVAAELGIDVEERESSLGDYYHLGQVGDSRVNAVKMEMGPLRAYPSRPKNALFSRLKPAYWDRL